MTKLSNTLDTFLYQIVLDIYDRTHAFVAASILAV